MAKYQARPRKVDAHQHQQGAALPAPFDEFQASDAYGVIGGIRKDMSGNLLVPNGNGYTTATFGDWLVTTIEGKVSVLKDPTFQAAYEPDPDAEPAPAVEGGEENQAEG